MDADQANDAWKREKNVYTEAVALQNDIADVDFYQARKRLEDLPFWQAIHVAVRAATYSAPARQEALMRFCIREDLREGKNT